MAKMFSRHSLMMLYLCDIREHDTLWSTLTVKRSLKALESTFLLVPAQSSHAHATVISASSPMMYIWPRATKLYSVDAST